MKNFFLGTLILFGILTGCAQSPTSKPSYAELIRSLGKPDLAGERERARRAGLLISMKEMRQTPPPADQNAATYYIEMTRRIGNKPLPSTNSALRSLTRAGSLKNPDWAGAKKVLDQNAILLRLAHRAAALPGCVFVRDWANPHPEEILFPHLPTVREAARLIEAESLVLAHDGKLVAAVQNETLIFRMAYHGASDRTLIGYLVGVAVDSIGIGGLQKIMAISKGDPRVADAVQVALAKWKPRPPSKYLRSEVAMQLSLFDRLRRDNGFKSLDKLADGKLEDSIPIDWKKFDAKGWKLFIDANEVYMLRQMQKIIAVSDDPYTKTKPILQAINQELEDRTPAKIFPHLLAAILFPVETGIIEKGAGLEARVKVTLLGAAILSYRASHGTYPDTVAAALPTVPTDPFDGEPLRYRREGSGFVVYSVGTSGKFTGDVSHLEKPSSEAFFRYP